jgi:hypothetical protein
LAWYPPAASLRGMKEKRNKHDFRKVPRIIEIEAITNRFINVEISNSNPYLYIFI